MESRLKADCSDHSGATLPCGCGGVARYAGRRDKTFTTALGEMTLSRAYYHCDTCGHGWCPRDLSLGLAETSLSPAVTRMVGVAAAEVSFETSSELLAELGGVDVDAKQVERAAEALGRVIAHHEEQHVIEPPQAADVPHTVYLGLDGTGIPMRKAELEDRAGKQPDGSAKTREVKLCVTWSAESRDKDGRPVRDEGSVAYSAAIESVASRECDEELSPFARRVLRATSRVGLDRARRQVVLGDGAAWIWNLADLHFPDAIQIVDLFHAKEHLSNAAKAIYGPTSDLARPWSKARGAELEAGQLDLVLTALQTHADTCPEAKNCLDYLDKNRSRMRYDAFRAQGLCVASGVVEAGCKTAVGARLKRAGMHWSLPGANAILALRCCKLSGRFEDFWESRTDILAEAR